MQKKQVDTIIYNARIYTVNERFDTANAMAILKGKIVAIGNKDSILQHFSAHEMLDEKGQTIFPGFIDAHAHFVGYGKELFTADLGNTHSFDEVLERLKIFVSHHPNQPWIMGRGWDQNKWPGKAFPNSVEKLNQLFPHTPVFLTRVDGHAAIVNAKAIEIAGIYPGEKITGGSFESFHGKLTGVLIDNAQKPVLAVIPALSAKAYAERLVAAQQNCFAVGLTTVTDCGLSYKDVLRIDSLQKAGILKMQLYVMLSDAKENYDYFLPKGPYKTDKLFVNGFKFYADGALGSRGACLLQPYTDKNGWYGFLLSSAMHFDSMAQVLIKTPFQMCTHAIGDSGNRVILQVYNKYLKGKNDRRWRIEHAQVVAPNDFTLFGAASIIPSVQPTHATSDMYWAESRLGKNRLHDAYASKKLLAQNGWLPLGTDFPVEDISPFKTFLAAVFRVDSTGFPPSGFMPENALSRTDAIRGMTIWAAKADFLEQEKGSLEVGKNADFVVLNSDLMQVPWNKVLQTKVLATYISGQKVF
jgi:predicted amidohydrolase YtcJ